MSGYLSKSRSRTCLGNHTSVVFLVYLSRRLDPLLPGLRIQFMSKPLFVHKLLLLLLRRIRFLLLRLRGRLLHRLRLF